MLISIFVFAGLMAFILYLGYRFYARPGRVYEQLGGPASLWDCRRSTAPKPAS